MKIALAQIDMIYNDKQANYPMIEKYIEQASLSKADLIVFPEMTTTGFSMDCSTDSSLDIFQELSRKYQIKILYGEAIEKQGKRYNNAKLVDGNQVLLDYDKIHPFYNEAKYYASGDKISTCTIDDITLTCFICFDLRFPEIFQYASTKCNLIFVIASWPDIRDDHWLTLLKARAIENQCYVVGVNRVGQDPKCKYIGHSVIYDANGKRCNTLIEQENLFVFEIDNKTIQKSIKLDNIKPQRKNNLYIKYLSEKS